MSNPSNFAAAISGALEGRATTIGENSHQSERGLAVTIAHDVVRANNDGGRHIIGHDDIVLLARQLLRALHLPE